MGAAEPGVTEAFSVCAGQTRGLVDIRGTVGGLAVTVLRQVALTRGRPALSAGRGEGAAGDLAAAAGAAGGARAETAELGVTAGVGAVIGGIFGMNLKNGLEDHWSAFYLVTGITTMIMCCILVGLLIRSHQLVIAR